MNIVRSAKITVIIISIALFITACGGSKATDENANKPAAEPIEVTTSKAEVRELPSYFESTGPLASDAQTDVAPTIAGKIIQVNFDVGSYVNKGDVLVKLDPQDAQIRLDQANRQADQAEAQVEQVKTTVTQAEAAADQARANLRQQQIRLGLTEGYNFNINEFSQVIAVRAQLELAEKELTRTEKLLASGDVSKSIYDQRLAGRNQLLGQLEEAKSNAAVAIKAIQVAMEAVKTAEAQVGTAKANVGTAEAAYRTSLTGVDAAKKTVSDTAIYAPFSGYVAERTADLGEFTNPNTPNAKIATIVRTAVLRLKIDVPEQSIGKIATGQGISAQVSAYPDRNFAGTVVRISPSLNTTSRTLTVEAEMDNPGGLLKPGQFATVRITQTKPVPAVVIPASAVASDGSVNRVFVINEGVAEERLVQIGLLENNFIEIKQGLKEGEIIATSNIDKLGDGVIVRQ